MSYVDLNLNMFQTDVFEDIADNDIFGQFEKQVCEVSAAIDTVRHITALQICHENGIDLPAFEELNDDNNSDGIVTKAFKWLWGKIQAFFKWIGKMYHKLFSKEEQIKETVSAVEKLEDVPVVPKEKQHKENGHVVSKDASARKIVQRRVADILKQYGSAIKLVNDTVSVSIVQNKFIELCDRIDKRKVDIKALTDVKHNKEVLDEIWLTESMDIEKLVQYLKDCALAYDRIMAAIHEAEQQKSKFEQKVKEAAEAAAQSSENKMDDLKTYKDTFIKYTHATKSLVMMSETLLKAIDLADKAAASLIVVSEESCLEKADESENKSNDEQKGEDND